jgi:hypothetical protein
MNKKITFFTIFFLASAGILIADKNGPSSDHTGAPLLNGNPGTTCATSNCHDDNTNNSGNLTIAVTEKGKLVPVTKYEIGKTYTVGLILTGKLGSRYGFSATILDPSRVKTGTTNGATSGAKIVSISSRSIAMHDAPSLTGIFSFDWTPPASPSDSVTLYVAGNAANGDNAKTGDQILLKSVKLYCDKTSSVSHSEASAFRFFPNPAKDMVNLSKNADKVVVYDLNGKVVLEKINTNSLDIHSLQTGIYFANITAGKNTSVVKLVEE